MKNKKVKVLFILLVVGVVVLLCASYADYNNSLKGQFTVKYDSSWKRVSGSEFKLKHKKTGSILNIQSKMIEDNYSDVKLEDFIDEVVFSIEQQNDGYSLINMKKNDDSKYESFSYLYEKGMEQVLVSVYKKNDKLVIAFYQAESESYDVVLDSVDTILNSLEIS